jgi:glycosyltransferase involved in cell wall biosynthesis
VLPFRNALPTLPECLDSVQQQSLGDFEALLVDDGSGDGSAEIVRERAREDRRLMLLQPGRIGLVAALNLGIAHARAGLIARMDADDIMHPDRLRLQYERLHRDSDIALVGCQVELFPEHAVRAGYREYVRWQNRCVEPHDIAANLYVESPLAHPSVMMRKGAVEAAGGYAEGPFPEDYDLWLRMHEAGCRMAKVPRVLLSWRERHDRTSRVDARYSREAFDGLRARYLARDRRVRSARELVVWGGGRPTRLRVRRLLEHGVRAQAWVDVNPRRIGKTIWGLPVHPPVWLDREPRPFVLVYVTSHGARDEVAAALEGWGYRRGVDYLAVG